MAGGGAVIVLGVRLLAPMAANRARPRALPVDPGPLVVCAARPAARESGSGSSSDLGSGFETDRIVVSSDAGCRLGCKRRGLSCGSGSSFGSGSGSGTGGAGGGSDVGAAFTCLWLGLSEIPSVSFRASAKVFSMEAFDSTKPPAHVLGFVALVSALCSVLGSCTGGRRACNFRDKSARRVAIGV